jgi:putative sigma-54 modulation protein
MLPGLQSDRRRFSFPGGPMNDSPEQEETLAGLGPIGTRDASLRGRISPMNRQNNHELIVSAIHFELTPSLKTFVREKADRLFRHEEHIVRFRVELEYEPKEDVANRFKAKGHITIHGPDMNAVVASDECHKAIALLTDKLDRMLRRRSRLFKVKRKQKHPVEFDVALPKVGFA